MVAIGEKWSGQILAVCSTLFPLCHIMIRKKCFDLFDRVEGGLRKENTCILALYSLICGIFLCFGLFPLWCPGLDFINSCSLPPFLF